MTSKNRLASSFVFLVWITVVGILGYYLYMKLAHDIEVMNLKFKTLEEIVDGYP